MDNKRRGNSTKTRFSSNKKYGSGEKIKKKKKSSLHSSMTHLTLTCCIILQSIIKIFQMATEKQARNEVKNMNQGT